MSAYTTIRCATLTDANSLASLAAQSFRAAFAADNAIKDMDDYVREAFAVEQIERELQDEANTFFVAEHPERITLQGYAKLRAGHPEPCVSGPNPVEIERLYAAPEAIGTGVGAALMQACLDAAKAHGYATVWLGVWEENHRACRFYEKWGFITVGSHDFLLGNDLQSDLVMSRAL